MDKQIKQLNTTMGAYLPAFFDLYLNTDKSMDSLSLQMLSDSEKSAFFHEYIHFLQDITSTCGLFNIYVINETFRLVATQCATQNPFELPAKVPSNEISNNVLLNKYINKAIFGEGRDYPYSSIKITQIAFDDVGNKESKSKNINHIPIIKFQSYGTWWEFGYKEIMESMAYILQRLCTNSFQSPEFPYLTAERIAEFICPNFAKDILNIIALCDVALMTNQPGAYFVNYISEIASGKNTISKPEDIYDDYYKICGTDCNGVHMSSLQHYEALYTHAKQALKSYIAIPCIRCKLNKWIDLVLDTGYNIRKNRRYFFLDLAREGDLLSNNTFMSLFLAIGTPLMHNNHGAYGRFQSHPNDYGDVMQYLLAILPIYNTFCNGIVDENGKTIECYMKAFCQSSGKQTDSTCITPWLKVKDRQLCPVATIWKHRKLAVNPIKI